MTPEEAKSLYDKVRVNGLFNRGKMRKDAVVTEITTKKNYEMFSQGEGTESAELIDEAWKKVMNEEVKAYTLPHKTSTPRFNCYVPGGHYRRHADACEMEGVRTDFAVTLALTPPKDYKGGELMIYPPDKSEHAKLAAGQAVVYECRWPHEVTKVTNGTRISMIFWIESLFPDPRHRDLLKAMGSAVRSLKREHPAQPEFTCILEDLKRLWMK